MSTVIHRFTPPTCTLEIRRDGFPFSFWSKSNSAEIRFELKFDDPRVLTSQQTTIKGDRRNLDQIKAAVELYLRQYLQSSFKSESQSERQFQHQQLYLKQKGLVSHELCLDFLNDVDRIRLTTVQLFDLATVLEAYSEDAALTATKSPQIKAVLFWTIAATTAIAIGVGISTSLLKKSVPNLAPVAEPEPQTPVAEIDEVVPPQTTTAERSPQPKLSEPLSSIEKLPPPPAVDTPKPKPNIPDPADYPFPEAARQLKTDVTTQKPNSEQQTESFIAIAPETKIEANPQLNPPTSKSTTITDSSEPDVESSTIQIDPGINPELETENPSQIEPSEKTAQNNRRDLIAKSSQPSQIQQITAYFQEKWQPPAELKQSLEYRLWLNADGTIERVVPLGKASQLYIDRTNIPLKGESFIDSKSQSSVVRLLLSPDGGVQALSE